MFRQANIDALLARSDQDFVNIRGNYEKSLHQKAVSPELKIDIKNFCGNLRSVLDYIAHDVREVCCPLAPQAIFYFPILPNMESFNATIRKAYPGLQAARPDVWNYLQSVQPYQPNRQWLGDFNRLNNEHKHDNLVEQKRTESHG